LAKVTVGAIFGELFGTGYNTNGVYDATLLGTADPHYKLYQSADVNNLGPNALVWDMTQYPLAQYSGFFANADGASAWIGPNYNPGGATYTSPNPGTYSYRINFLLDSVDLTQPLKLQGTWWTGNEGADILLNGKATGNPGLTNQQNTGSSFVITNGFVAGVNTLEFVVPLIGPVGGYNENAFRAEVSGIGQALPAGLPAIAGQPANQTVVDANVASGSVATFSVVALGRPPLSYQWWADGTPIGGATNRTLSFVSPSSSAQPGANFSVVIKNDSGSVTSRLAVLTLVSTNQPPLVPNFSLVVYSNTTATFNLDTAFLAATDADNDPLSLAGTPFDATSTNGASITQNGVVLTYTPMADYLGQDEFNYYISDSQGATTAGAVNIMVVPLQIPAISAKLGAGNNLVLNATSGSAGGSFHELSTTNLTLPLTNWTTAASGAFNSSGKASVTNAIVPGIPQQFYILTVP
jgi:hypothetical protein